MPEPLRVARPAIRYAVRPLGALGAGLALWLSFPDHDLWPLAPVGVALLAAVTWRQGLRAGFGLGMLAGWASLTPVLSWSGTYVGVVPWFALATLQALYVATMSAVVGWGTARWAERGREETAYLLVPFGWVAQEMARSTTPWGGFPWARLAFSQADSPLARLAALGGAPLVGFAVAVVGVGLLVAARRLHRRRWLPALGVAAVLAAVLIQSANHRLPTDGRGVPVGYVQGDVPTAGLDFNAQRRAVLDNHVRETEALAARAPDDLSLVVWPENSSDIDPFRNPDAAAQIERAVEAVHAPLLVGAVLVEPPGHNSNVSLLYRPGGGVPERYTKLHPVPFAEYIPYRSFFRLFSAEADKAGNFVAGDTIGAFRVPSPTGPYWALPTICFEVAYDGLMRESVTNPALGQEESLLVVQTNNATFGFTAESEQQFAISRLRAIEHGRSIVHVSTVGVSGFIAPDGSVTHKSGLFVPATAVSTPVVRTGLTVSDRLGPWPERGAVLIFLTLLAVGAMRARTHEAAAER